MRGRYAVRIPDLAEILNILQKHSLRAGNVAHGVVQAGQIIQCHGLAVAVTNNQRILHSVFANPGSIFRGATGAGG